MKSTKNAGRLRYVDFNQGVDARLFNDRVVNLLSEIPVRPLRIAFDNIKTEDEYTKALSMSVQHGMKDFSNYLLYNFTDKPTDLYHRMRINVDLCEQLNVSIYSFPMKYIRAVQAILNATKGKIGRGVSFFEKAFGRNEEEFMELLIMPETFILFRFFFEHLGYTQKWRELMNQLSFQEREELYPIIFKNNFNHIEDLTTNPKFLHILQYYRDYRKDIADPKSELFRLKVEYDAQQINK